MAANVGHLLSLHHELATALTQIYVYMHFFYSCTLVTHGDMQQVI